MAASDDYLDGQIKVLEGKITTQNIPFSDHDHRKTVDLINCIKKSKRLALELEASLGIPIRPSVETYFGLVKNE